MKKFTMPHPREEGYRTAHEQNNDGSYKYTVVPADLTVRKPGLPVTPPRSSGKAHNRWPVLRSDIDEDRTIDTHTMLLRTVGKMVDLYPGGKRRITKRMEEAYRLRHHEFEGRTAEETACRMGIGVQAVKNLLWEMCKIAPQLFPILTPMQAKVWHLFNDEGMPHHMIAGTLDITTGASKMLVKRVKEKLGYHKRLYQRLIVMDPKDLDRLEIGKGIKQVF